uniref:UBA domain-containing protein n=1 Tax=Timema bartmani TaxID=61472 RepID=A0A7R9F2M3_9NEOP|nr:unnamed protein product [Timema bartmani]
MIEKILYLWDLDHVVRPRVKLFSCLDSFSQSEIVEQFYSTAINAKTTARKTTRLASFPDYLLIHLKKFTLREDWVPIKLDVAVEMPDILDLSSLRGSGPQPGEDPLPELTGTPPPPPQLDQNILEQLMDMGFPPEACKKAVFFTDNRGLEEATSWVMEHVGDSDFGDPFVPPGTDAKAGGLVVPLFLQAQMPRQAHMSNQVCQWSLCSSRHRCQGRCVSGPFVPPGTDAKAGGLVVPLFLQTQMPRQVGTDVKAGGLVVPLFLQAQMPRQVG